MNWDEVFSYEFPEKNAAAAPEVNPGTFLTATPKAREEQYEDVDDYDPVLRSHCRL